MHSYDFLTIGAATWDVFLVSDLFLSFKTDIVSTGIAECVALGSKIDIEKMVSTSGGGATNAATTFASLGFKTVAMCRVGDDEVSNQIINELKRKRIDTRFVRKIPNGQTAYSTLLTMEDGERTVLVYRGVSATFDEKDIDWKAIKKSKWIYITSLGGNIALVKKIIDFASSKKVHVAWNPGHAELQKGMKVFEPILKCVDVLLINREEAELLTGEKLISNIFSKLKHDTGVRIISNGKNGTDLFFEGNKKHIGTTGAKGISKTGAGDAFGSGFVALYAKFRDPIKAAQHGTLNAESVIKHLGAKKGILKEWPTEKQLNKVPIKK